MDDHQLKQALESILFVSGSPLTVDRLKGIFEETTREQIETQLRALQQDYEERVSGIMLAEVANGYQLATRPECASWIRKLKSVKTSARLSKPALETLAIVAYKQPITRMEVETVRGVNIGGIMRNLMERRLVKIVGKKDIPGKPMMYGTTVEFLQYFGLKDLSALPTLKEFQELEAGEEVMEEINAEMTDSEDTSAEDIASGEASKEAPADAMNEEGSSEAPPEEVSAVTIDEEESWGEAQEEVPLNTIDDENASEEAAATESQPADDPAEVPVEESLTG